jgi:hypothetical protein
MVLLNERRIEGNAMKNTITKIDRGTGRIERVPFWPTLTELAKLNKSPADNGTIPPSRAGRKTFRATLPERRPSGQP